MRVAGLELSLRLRPPLSQHLLLAIMHTSRITITIMLMLCEVVGVDAGAGADNKNGVSSQLLAGCLWFALAYFERRPPLAHIALFTYLK